MPGKTPDLDSMVLLQGEQVDFQVEFDGPGPKGVKLFADGELGLTDKVHPDETEWTFGPTFEEPGEFSLQIVVEGPAAGEMETLRSRDSGLGDINEVERANATWDIVVADPDELYQSDSERIKELIMTVLALYTLGEISLKSVKRVQEYLDETVLEETTEEVEHELTTLDDFLDARGGASSDEKTEEENCD